MDRIRIALYFLVAIFLFSACQQNGGRSQKKVLRNGYAYVNYTNNKGDRPKIDHVVTIDFDIVDDFGNILSDSRKANIRPTVQVPESMDYQTRRNPLLALIEVMTHGDSASVFVPVDSLSSPPQEFRQSKTVEYRVVVRSIELPDDYMSRVGSEQQKLESDSFREARIAFEKYKAGEYDDRLVEKNGEIMVAIIDSTDGVTADFDELAFVHYYGFFRNGESFDNSYRVGKSYGFRVGRGSVIQGWDIAIPDIPEGATAIIDIPHQMAYGNEGKEGTIPPQSDLIYWVKIDRVEKSKKVEN